MSTYEILNAKGDVENVIVADAAFVEENYPGRYREVTEPPAPLLVPESVTRFQAKAALLNAGLLAQVEAAVQSADPLVQLAWSEATTFERNSPALVLLAEEVGMSSADLDALFEAAKAISV